MSVVKTRRMALLPLGQDLLHARRVPAQGAHAGEVERAGDGHGHEREQQILDRKSVV